MNDQFGSAFDQGESRELGKFKFLRVDRGEITVAVVNEDGTEESAIRTRMFTYFFEAWPEDALKILIHTSFGGDVLKSEEMILLEADESAVAQAWVRLVDEAIRDSRNEESSGFDSVDDLPEHPIDDPSVDDLEDPSGKTWGDGDGFIDE